MTYLNFHVSILLNRNKRKFIDFSGNELSIFNEYPHLENFSEGLASFQEDSGNKWGVINRNGEVVIPCKEESFRIGPFENGLALVYQNFWFYDYQDKGIETIITITVGYLCKKGTEYWEDSSDPMYFVRKGNNNLEITKDSSQIKDNFEIELISPEYSTYLYSKAILIDNNCFIAYFKRGALKLRCRKYTEAFYDYSKAIELNPNDYKSYLQRGGASFFKGDYAEAIEDYSKSIRLNPDNWISYLNRANAWFTIGKYADAITDCSLALEIEPQNGECYFYRGKAKHMLEDLTACDDWRSACKLGIKKAVEMLEKNCK